VRSLDLDAIAPAMNTVEIELLVIIILLAIPLARSL
jgi:hypothetical protein